MGHRINERNTGHWSVDGEPKARRQKVDKNLTTNQKHLLAQVLEKILFSLEHDQSGRGHLHPESRWDDAGNITIAMSGAQKDELYNALEKLK